MHENEAFTWRGCTFRPLPGGSWMHTSNDMNFIVSVGTVLENPRDWFALAHVGCWTRIAIERRTSRAGALRALGRELDCMRKIFAEVPGS